MPETQWKLEHPAEKISYPDAIKHVEKWLEKKMLTAEDVARGTHCSIWDYHDGNPDNLAKRPWVGVRVSEVSFAHSRGGSSYMQVDMPWGVAFCGQVERCILALVEGWNEGATANGPNYGETDEEFWRLGNLIEESRK